MDHASFDRNAKRRGDGRSAMAPLRTIVAGQAGIGAILTALTTSAASTGRSYPRATFRAATLTAVT
jgi:hypothetical protein